MTLLDAALSILAARKSALTLAELTAAATSSKQVGKVTPAQEKALARGLDKLAATGAGVEKVGEAYRAAAAAAAGKNGKAKPAPAKAKAAPAKAKAAPAAAKAKPGKAAAPAKARPTRGAAAEAAPVESGPASAAPAEAAPAMTEEERALAEVYGDELTAPAPALREFRDERTQDEDRKMLPEINARQERHKQWEDRRNERRERRDRERNERRDRRDRERPAGAPAGGGGGGGGREPQHGGGRPEARADGGGREAQRGGREPQHGGGRDHRDGARVEARPEQPRVVVATGTGIGTPLGDAAAALFAQLRNAQPVPVKQLAGMMRKRGLIDADPEQVWPHLKASLLGDESIFRARGLRPRIVYRGRDLFAPGPVMSSPTAAAESTLADALAGLAAATARTLGARLARANQAGFERLAHAYLVAAGFADITWVKRLDGISYATALPAGGDKAILVSARSGDSPVERRGVGELRVGVEAKDLAWGLLLAGRELSDEARRELERPGRSISALVGDGLVAAMMAAGVGVVTAAAPVRYLDEQLLDELLAGA
jgi:hypothetical protein